MDEISKRCHGCVQQEYEKGYCDWYAEKITRTTKEICASDEQRDKTPPRKTTRRGAKQPDYCMEHKSCGRELMEAVLIRCRACGKDLTNEDRITWYYCPESERIGNEVDECSPFCVVCPEEPTEKSKQFIQEVKELIDENTDIEVALSQL